MFNELFICFCFSAAILAVPVESLESTKNSDCLENGNCIETKNETELGFDMNCTDSGPITYHNQLTDEFGNGIGNVSIVDLKHLLSTLIEKEDTHEKIRRDVDSVFQGVIVAVILFGVCASICVVFACIYCCRINIRLNKSNSMNCEEDNNSMDSCRLFEGLTSMALGLISLSVVILAFACCICIKISDMKLQAYIRKLAKRKGVKLDLEKQDQEQAQKMNSPGSHLNENCTIMVPDVAIVL